MIAAAWHSPVSLADVAELGRLERFREDHPEWSIGFDHDGRYWQGLRRDGDETIAVRYLLGDLLDRLDALAAPDTG